MGRQHKRAPQIEPEMLPTPALTDRFKGLGLRPLSRPRASSRDGHPRIELAGAMVHLSWPLRAHMSGGGCLPGGVAAGLLHLLGAREIPENRARLPLRPVLRSPPARRPIAFRLTFCPRGPCPFSRSPLLGFRPLLGSPPPPVSLRSHLCSQPGIISLGVCVKKASFSKERRRKAVFSFALAARHFSPRSRTLGCVVFLLAPRAPMCKRSSQ